MVEGVHQEVGALGRLVHRVRGELDREPGRSRPGGRSGGGGERQRRRRATSGSGALDTSAARGDYRLVPEMPPGAAGFASTSGCLTREILPRKVRAVIAAPPSPMLVRSVPLASGLPLKREFAGDAAGRARRARGRRRGWAEVAARCCRCESACRAIPPRSIAPFQAISPDTVSSRAREIACATDEDGPAHGGHREVAPNARAARQCRRPCAPAVMPRARHLDVAVECLRGDGARGALEVQPSGGGDEIEVALEAAGIQAHGGPAHAHARRARHPHLERRAAHDAAGIGALQAELRGIRSSRRSRAARRGPAALPPRRGCHGPTRPAGPCRRGR